MEIEIKDEDDTSTINYYSPIADLSKNCIKYETLDKCMSQLSNEYAYFRPVKGIL